MNNLKINVPSGFEIDQDNSTFEEIVFKKIDDAVTCWEDLGEIEGWYHEEDNLAFSGSGRSSYSGDRNLFATKEQAQACIALAQLSQLMKHVNGDWVPDWSAGKEACVIEFMGGVPYKNSRNILSTFLAFPTAEIRDAFLGNHRDLIMSARSLL